MTIDIALAIEAIIPAAQYSGSVTANTYEAWDRVIWGNNTLDGIVIPKPTWLDIENAWKGLSIQLAIKEYDDKITEMLDEVVKPLYANIDRAISYIGDNNPIWDIEARYCKEFRSKIWVKAHNIMNDYNPDDPIPTWEEIKAQLPIFEWPEGSRGYVAPEPRKD